MLNPKNCINCNAPLHGRQDKKFCSDQCRATYNNRMKRKHEALILNTNKILRRNRTILRSLCPLGKSTVRRESLVEMGFDFSHFTTIFPTGSGIYFFAYEFGWMPIEEKSNSEGHVLRKVLIIQHQEYMNKPLDPWRIKI